MMNNNIDVKNNIDDNIETLYSVHQFKRKIFKRIPSKIRKKTHYINVFNYNFKSYHVAIGINIYLIDDYQKYKWKSLVLNIEPNFDIISFDYSRCKLILSDNCLPNNRYKIIGDIFKNYMIFIRINMIFIRS
jgi:hypothetical protein